MNHHLPGIPRKGSTKAQGFGSFLPKTDSQNTPAMSTAASVALVTRFCRSSTRDKDRQGLATGRCLASCTSGCLGHTDKHLEQGTTSARRASHPATEWRCTHRAQDGPTRFPSHGKAHDGAAELSQELGLHTKPPPVPGAGGAAGSQPGSTTPSAMLGTALAGPGLPVALRTQLPEL